MKKVFSAVLAVLLTVCVGFSFAGCATVKTVEVVLITDGAPVNDGGYNESAWNGVKAFAEENGIACRYYQPDLSDEAAKNETIAKYIDLAVKKGANRIVLPGETFAVSAYEVAPTYKDVKFVLIDAYPHSQDDDAMRMQQNVECISFDKVQAGFLAGYTAVISGLYDAKGKVLREQNTKLGYFGSFTSQDSADYGAGFLQGVGYAADEKKIPVYLDYAEFDNPQLNYDYSFTIEPEYIKREDAKKDTFKVTVVDGIGSGIYSDGENVTITANPAPENKKFDHWEVKSDTDGVRDKKVNISSKKDSSMNLLVGDCDCTITAVWADTQTVPVTVTEKDGATAHEVINAEKNSEIWVEAPAASSGCVFDFWNASDESVISDKNAKGISVKVGETPIVLKPNYRASDYPTFDVTVKNGTGSGAYVAGDEVRLVADAPAEGYMFYRWKNIDHQGLATGIAMENEYCYHTTFTMVDRFASVAEKMYDDGCQVVFGGGSPVSDSLFTAASVFDFPVFVFGYGIDEGRKGNCIASVVNDYGAAAKQALSDFKGGQFFTADCSNRCIYVTGKSVNEYVLDGEGNRIKDKKGNEQKDGNYDAGYAAVYQALSDKTMVPLTVQKGTDIRSVNRFRCLTLHSWITE